MPRPQRLAFVLALAASGTTPAAAQLNQPDGTSIPQTGDVQGVFDARSDPVSAVTDGAVTPETFVPACVISFEVLLRDAGFLNVFGWYNVTGTKPTTAELFTLLGPDDGVGARAALDIRSDGRYLGADIGFWMKTPEGCGDNRADPARSCGYLYFSERRYNEDGAGGIDSYIHLITYDSRADPATFYFAWEDLFRGGDNDFSDIVTIVDNIVCTGAGGDCDTGMLGVCAVGTMQCASGSLTCVPARGPGAEACNGLDDDCDGAADEGELCSPGEVCRVGDCVPECGGLEFVCAATETCVEGVCVADDCVDIVCEAGEVCRGGVCRGACDGVTCPAGRRCLFGACVDPCDGLICDPGQHCVDGVCRPGCDCRPCEGGLTCTPEGRCEDPACGLIICDAGFVCVGGACLDACAGAVCPSGQICELGECVGAPRVDAGPMTGRDAGAPGDAGGGGTLDAGRDAGPRRGGGGLSGCACRVPTPSRPHPWAPVLASMALLLTARPGRRA